jgi:hypothetical protein
MSDSVFDHLFGRLQTPTTVACTVRARVARAESPSFHRADVLQQASAACGRRYVER